MSILSVQSTSTLRTHHERLWTIVMAWLMVAGLFAFLANVMAAEMF